MTRIRKVQIRNPSYAAPLLAGQMQSKPMPQFARGRKVRLGLLSNQKPNTNELLDLVVAGLAARYQVEARLFRKPDEAHPASTEVIREISSFADLAIVSSAD